jgi:hypothetical protein
MREVALQYVEHSLGLPGGDEVGVNGFVAVISAIFYCQQDIRVSSFLVEKLIRAEGEVLETMRIGPQVNAICSK